ncbi:glycoside hydrolase family 15 protein [Streptomyces sp. NPDC055085]
MEKASNYSAISDYAFLSDGHSLMLVSKDGSVDWACFHRYDGAPVFAGILDSTKGGSFSIRPTSAYTVTRRYLPDTNVLETLFETASGAVTLTDFLPVHEIEGRPGKPGRRSPGHTLLRKLVGITGSMNLKVEFFPTFDYARVSPSVLHKVEHRITIASSTNRLTLDYDDMTPTANGMGYIGSIAISAGGESYFTLTSTLTGEEPPAPANVVRQDILLNETLTFWRNWANRCSYQGPYRGAVVRSLITLKGLIYDKTGAPIAAPTTSLPESIGGPRNWDYRFTWLRDSSAMLTALVATGYLQEAKNFADWIFLATQGRAEDIQVLYGIDGKKELTEELLDHLDGYRGSRPVRIGNAAYGQFQLDIYGELLAAACFASSLPGYQVDRNRASFIRDVVELTIQRWQEPDEGIWEVRSSRQHFVFSKLMAWLAVDSGIRMLDNFSDIPRNPELRQRWVQARDKIRRAVEERGVDPERGCFVQAFGINEPDAATLQLILRRFLRPDDPRLISTIREIEDHLTENGHVYRYRTHDGLSSQEGAFTFCTLWMASALARTGRVHEAERRLELVLSFANDVGLLSEEIEPESKELLGNFPQGFSHLGIIAAALEIEMARSGAEGHARLP